MPESTPLPEHIARPEIRHFQRMAVERDGRMFVGLRDPSMISQEMIVLPEQALPVVAHFNGRHSLEEISDRLGVPMAPLQDLAKKLDEIGMLWGPTYSRLESTLRERYHREGAFPGMLTRMWGQDEAACRAMISRLLDAAEDPELGSAVAGIVAPHLDPERGGAMYASAYRALAEAERPERVVILGTNHFGQGDGVVMSRLGFDTPLGRTNPDVGVLDTLERNLGDRLFKDEMDHVGEHSIQLHLPWVRHVLGDVPVVAALIPDPNVPMLSDDGARVSHAEFTAALREALREAPGRTVVISSSDLSHVGAAFGDQKPVDEQQQDEVERHDREMLGLFAQGDPSAFVAEMASRRNPTRWCSVGSMSATASLTDGAAIELIDYHQSMDPRRLALVSCAAIALVNE